ncbi:MAG: hypothetical protein R2867_41800 [Caldilineaceae bacterium]
MTATNGSLLHEKTVLQVNNLKKYYPVESGFLKRQVGEVRGG